jgi:hypothetical protein
VNVSTRGNARGDASRGVARVAVALALGLPLAASCTREPTDRDAALSLAPQPSLATYAPSENPARVVVLVALDGVRWQEIFDGVERERAAAAGMAAEEMVGAPELVPNLWWLMGTRGAALGRGCGSSIRASGPEFVSLPGYLEMLSGKRKTGCYSNDCAPPARTTLVDEIAAHTEPGEVAVFASWPPLAHTTKSRSALVSAGRGGTNLPELVRHDDRASAIFDEGERAEAYPGIAGYRPDRFTSAIAVRYLRARLPRFMFLSLGDTDEYGHRDDYRSYLQALHAADTVVGDIAVALQDLSATGLSTLLIVTTDHGRSNSFADHGKYPESADVWLVAAGDAVRARGCIASDVPHHLADIAPTIRAVADLQPQGGQILSELFEPQALAARYPLAP